MVLLIIIPMKNGYFIGNIPYFQTNPFGHVGQPWHVWRTLAASTFVAKDSPMKYVDYWFPRFWGSTSMTNPSYSENVSICEWISKTSKHVFRNKTIQLIYALHQSSFQIHSVNRTWFSLGNSPPFGDHDFPMKRQGFPRLGLAHVTKVGRSWLTTIWSSSLRKN